MLPQVNPSRIPSTYLRYYSIEAKRSDNGHSHSRVRLNFNIADIVTQNQTTKSFDKWIF